MNANNVRLDSLTGLRAVAALAVLLSHLRHLLPDAALFSVSGHAVDLQMFMRPGDVGVSLFFVLSGFVLMWSHRAGDSNPHFWGRRVGRIYPLHVVVWCAWLAVAVPGVLPTPNIGPAIAGLLLVQAWIPQAPFYFAANRATWSLSCEVFFYALFPFIGAGLQRLGLRSVARITVAVGLLALVLPVAFLRFTDPADGFYLSYVFPPTRLLEFVLGACLASLVANGQLRNVPLGWSAAAAAVAYVIAGRGPRILADNVVTLVPFAFVVVAAAGSDLAERPSILRGRVARHLGEVSFAVFIVQYGVIELFKVDRPGGARTYAGGLFLCAAATVVIMALAEGLHALVERPAERWFRRRFARPDHAALATLASSP